MLLTWVRLLRTKHPASQQWGVLGQRCLSRGLCEGQASGSMESRVIWISAVILGSEKACWGGKNDAWVSRVDWGIVLARAAKV